mmetsp:Transcript_9479/g.27323  ORF Transcript_9479/g.27323 Transcript_9479/m.27323 type:complete len:233 (-) Transcript_9479:824-1522(-)
MGQIRNTRKIYFLNYNKLRLLLILRICICTIPVQVYLLLFFFVTSMFWQCRPSFQIRFYLLGVLPVVSIQFRVKLGVPIVNPISLRIFNLLRHVSFPSLFVSFFHKLLQFFYAFFTRLIGAVQQRIRVSIKFSRLVLLFYVLFLGYFNIVHVLFVPNGLFFLRESIVRIIVLKFRFLLDAFDLFGSLCQQVVLWIHAFQFRFLFASLFNLFHLLPSHLFRVLVWIILSFLLI